MNIKIRIVKDSKWLTAIVVLFLAAVVVLLSHEMGRMLHDSSALLPVFAGSVLVVVISKLLLDHKISLTDGYAEFNGQSIYIHSGSGIYVGNWDVMKKSDLVYKGDAINLFGCTIGNKSTLKIEGNSEMSFQLHFPSKAQYVSIISYINRLQLIEEQDALLIQHADMHKFMFQLDGEMVPTNNRPAESQPAKSQPIVVDMLPVYCFAPSVQKIAFH